MKKFKFKIKILHSINVKLITRFTKLTSKGRRTKNNYLLQTVNPLSVTKIGVFFLLKENKMQNVLKRENMQKYFDIFARVSIETFSWYFLKYFPL